MKSNEIFAIDLLPFRRHDLSQRASAAASARTSKGRPAAPTAPSQVGPLEDQPTEAQKATSPRHPTRTPKRYSARAAKRRPAARASKRRHTPTIAKRRQSPATPETRRMMLLNDLYTIDHIEAGTATLRLNTAHPIFKGHFPDRPVLPGACQLQMIRELLSYITTKAYRLQKAAAIKFITPIEPRQNGTIRLNLQYGEEKHGGEENTTLRVTATLIAGEAVCLKFNGTFQAE
jgi:3-hydroxyacyl-[acyl-carrier-protein] dehydratase